MLEVKGKSSGTRKMLWQQGHARGLDQERCGARRDRAGLECKSRSHGRRQAAKIRGHWGGSDVGTQPIEMEWCLG